MSLADELRKSNAPAWPIIGQGRQYRVPKLTPKIVSTSKYQTAVILPDWPRVIPPLEVKMLLLFTALPRSTCPPSSGVFSRATVGDKTKKPKRI